MGQLSVSQCSGHIGKHNQAVDLTYCVWAEPTPTQTRPSQRNTRKQKCNRAPVLLSCTMKTCWSTKTMRRPPASEVIGPIRKQNRAVDLIDCGVAETTPTPTLASKPTEHNQAKVHSSPRNDFLHDEGILVRKSTAANVSFSTKWTNLKT